MSLLRTIFIVVALASSAFGQAKVGTSGASFLVMSPSVKGNGMGGVGVTRWNGCWSTFFNPATLGIADQNYITIALYPAGADLTDAFVGPSQSSLAIAVKGSRLFNLPKAFSGGLCYQRASLSMGPFEETTVEYPEGTGRTYMAKDVVHSIGIGFGYSSTVEAAVGFTYKRLVEKIFMQSAYGNAFDLGFLLRVPLTQERLNIEDSGNQLRARLALGAAWSNYGPNGEASAIGFSDTTSDGRRRAITTDGSLTLPNTRRIGVGLEMSRSWWTAYPAIEWEADLADGMDRWRYGAEIGVLQILALRAGYVDEPVSNPNLTTFGFSASSQGFTKLLVTSESGSGDGFGDYLLKHLNVELSFARIYSRGGFYADGANYYAIEMSL